ncbi:MAG: 30S ribosomal protein S12 methylthiotransferase RimO [Hydrogenothermaceae bacterium]|nr:30S ribosomal protein S12 methylthiotransferase RimO [Hydrogenothermaceae bacterium]
MKKLKVSVISLGCPKNLVDTEALMGSFKVEEVEFISDSESADVILINTCGFIDAAKEESINAILGACQYKRYGNKKVVVTGCLVERYKQELEKEIPEVDLFVDLKTQKDIPLKVGLSRKTKPERIVSTPKHLAYLKISEGCDHTCSFCAIPNIRGKHKSRPIESIVEEAKMLADIGVRELNIVSQDTSYYGYDLYGKPMLFELLKKIEEVDGIDWIRLYYLYPSTVDEDFFKFISDSEKILRYIEMPIQHSEDNLLRDMMRGYRKRKLYQILDWKDKYTPDMAIRSSVIVGYPLETEKEFYSMLKFLEEAKFDWLGVFTYSHEEGTPAYERWEDRISHQEKLERFNQVLSIQEGITEEKNRVTVGKVFDILVDGFSEEWETLPIGRSYRNAYDIDGIIYIESTEPVKPGSIIRVKIGDVVDNYDLVGEVV